VSWNEAKRAETNVIARSDDRATTLRDDIATDAIAARVGAMDVSWSDAKRAETNVIARSDDRSTTIARRHCATTLHDDIARRHCNRQSPSQSSVVPNFFVSTNQLKLPYVLPKT
jgi:hypothetical protein